MSVSVTLTVSVPRYVSSHAGGPPVAWLRCKPTSTPRRGVGCACVDRALAVLRRSLESEFTLKTNVVKVNQLQMTPATCATAALPLAPPAAPADAVVVPIATAQARGLVFIPYK